MSSQFTPLYTLDDEGALGDAAAEDTAPFRSCHPSRRQLAALLISGGLAALLFCFATLSPHTTVNTFENFNPHIVNFASVFDKMKGDSRDCVGHVCMGKASQKLDSEEKKMKGITSSSMKLIGHGPNSYRVRITESTNSWKWDVKELEFYSDKGCSNKLQGSGYIESGHYGDDPNNWWAAKQAFDGQLNTGWGGRSSQNERFIGLQGLDAVRCLKIYLGEGDASKVAVEKLKPTGTWRALTEQSVKKEKGWNMLMVPDEKDFCNANEHVVTGNCVACPSGSAKPAGDDPFGGNTGCLCLANFRVSGGKCVSCPEHETNDAGDDTLKGDSVCDIFPVSSLDVGTTVGMHYPWTWTSSRGLQSQPTTPGDMNVAACKSKLIVAWSSQEIRPLDYENQWQRDGDTFGHISTFSTGKGAAKMMATHKMSVCSEMGGVAASPDCSVIAALCISRKGPSEGIPGFKTNLVNDNKDSKGRPPFGWDDVHEQQPDQDSAKRQILNAYLFEWTAGDISDRPDSSVLVNTAIGGWRYGNFKVALNAKNTIYSITLKTTLYGGGTYHEGAVRFEMSRPDFAYRHGTASWGCGEGHVLWNVQAYNDAKEKSGFWCWTDSPGQTYSTYFAQTGEGGDRVYQHPLLRVKGTPQWGTAIGGPTDIVSHGSSGWLGVLSTLESSSSSKMKVGLAQLPAGKMTWLNLAHHGTQGVSWPKLARLGSTPEESDRFLLGWGVFKPSGKKTSKEDIPTPTSFHLAEMDHHGALTGQVYQVDNTGWDVGTEWVTVPETGCVAWAFAWSETEGPRGQYGSWQRGAAFDGLYSKKLRVSIYCSTTDKPPPGPAPRPTPKPTPKPAPRPGPAPQPTQGTWLLGESGASCTEACKVKGLSCDEKRLLATDDKGGVEGASQNANYKCKHFVGWAYPFNPGVCTDKSCCGDGTCTDWCTVGFNPKEKGCAIKASSHYQRLCPCNAH